MNVVEFFGTFVKPRITKGKKIVMPLETGKINNDIWCIRDKDVNMFLLRLDKGFIAIDTGYKNSKYIQPGLNSLGIRGEEISHILITHLDLDHAGGIDKRCANPFPKAKVYLGKEEQKYLSGKYSRMRKFGLELKTPIKTDRTDYLLEDMETIKIGDYEIQAILTPGHTLGHLSFLVDKKYLFVGDTLIINHTGGYCFYDMWNVDSNLNRKSLVTLDRIAKENNCSLIITSHTGYTDNINMAFAHKEIYLNWKEKGFIFRADAPDNLYI
ncbi:MBL fold metallo-hydrolase [Anaerocolumna xylanovorans]|uniref:Glyoxylase, beta-lactamase superfamily II n=1 Tax=Anaerocolumna xylanovorans DSM 12503 TaxID=1121345 RepID=A0A1M7YLV1_9FIRM|nr:MBL fold metallo-hydrolase [Anaerocolumna xylanovorans]SHO53569.1 Glyoxylase, beta-lactamase superfamily II [Anaerocolumna xylanovorans DSM 12503]